MRRICHLFFMTQGGGVQSLLQHSGQLDQVRRDVCHDPKPDQRADVPDKPAPCLRV
uniref:hypothetical protein n=1 Tax=Paracoccus marcusii TaxID=59779 RepID=UPI00155DA935|nr:hypothetical protein [Paracoccus marcusii]